MPTIHEMNVRPATVRVRRAAERGHAQYDWLDTWHTFSFHTCYDPAQMSCEDRSSSTANPWEPATALR